MSDYITSLIRTVVPIAVGWLVATLANIGVDLDETAAVTALTGLVISIYYVGQSPAGRRPAGCWACRSRPSTRPSRTARCCRSGCGS